MDKYKGAKGKVDKTSGSYHEGAYVTVKVAGESKVYGTLDIFLIERRNDEAHNKLERTE